MLITRTPLRITLGGGGTDLPSYYEQYGGMVISAAISKHIYISINRTFTHDYFLKYSAARAGRRTPTTIEHPIVREVLLRPRRRRPASRSSARPTSRPAPGWARPGRSRSACSGRPRDAARPRQRRRPRPRRPAEIEIERLGRPVGKQDQYVAAFGGLNRFDFNPDGSRRRRAGPALHRHHARPRGAPADVLHRLLPGRRPGARRAGHQVDRRRRGHDRQPALRQGPRPAQLGRARAGRRRGLRRPHARALGEQEEALRRSMSNPQHRPLVRARPRPPARAAASWSAPEPAASCCSTPRTPAGCAPPCASEGLTELRFTLRPRRQHRARAGVRRSVQCSA